MSKPTQADLYYRKGTLRKHAEPQPTEPVVTYIDDLAYSAGIVLGAFFWVFMVYLMAWSLI